MKKSVILLALAFFWTVIGVAGCRISPTTTSSSTSEQPDDVIATPGGLAYRANITQQGVPNKWPPIQTVDVTLTSGSDSMQLDYRLQSKRKQDRQETTFFGFMEPIF
jgi:hypothetical protein